MGKKELAKEIEEGIVNGFWRPLVVILTTIFGSLLILMLIIYGISHYQTYKFQKEHPDFNPANVAMAEEINCNYPMVKCYTYREDGTLIYEGKYCGYQEANAWFAMANREANYDFRCVT